MHVYPAVNIVYRFRHIFQFCQSSFFQCFNYCICEFQRAYQAGFTRQHAYVVITALHSLTLVNTFGFLPKTFIPNPAEKRKEDQANTGDKEKVEQNGCSGETSVSKQYV